MRPPWVRRGTVKLEHLPDKSPATLRRLSDPDLYRFIAGWEPGSADWVAGDVELKRRQSSVGRWALAVSVFSLAVSTAALLLNAGRSH